MQKAATTPVFVLHQYKPWESTSQRSISERDVWLRHGPLSSWQHLARRGLRFTRALGPMHCPSPTPALSCNCGLCLQQRSWCMARAGPAAPQVWSRSFSRPNPQVCAGVSTQGVELPARHVWHRLSSGGGPFALPWLSPAAAVPGQCTESQTGWAGTWLFWSCPAAGGS